MKKLTNRKKAVIAVLSVILLVAAITGGYLFYQLNKIKTVQLPNDDSSLGISNDIQQNTEGDSGSTSTDVTGTESTADNGNTNEDNSEGTSSGNTGTSGTIGRSGITNILLLGEDAEDSSESGRSDTMMVLSINERDKKIKIVSIMRDMYVSIDGHGKTKINHAYAYGGPLLSIKTVNQNFLLDIRNYVKVDFSGLEKVVDLMGGVEVTIKDYEITPMSSVGITAPGTYNLNGKQALAYSRIRYFGNNDFERTERQRIIVTKLLEKINAGGPNGFPSIVSAVLPYVETSFSKTQIIDVGIKTLSIGITGIERTRIPYDGHYTNINNGVYYLGWEKNYTISQLHNFIWGQ